MPSPRAAQPLWEPRELALTLHPAVFDLRLENTTGETIQAVDISYQIWVYNDQNRANSLNLAFSFDDSTYTTVPELDYTTPEAASASPAWFSVDREITLTGLGLAAGEFLYLRFASGRCRRQRFA